MLYVFMRNLNAYLYSQITRHVRFNHPKLLGQRFADFFVSVIHSFDTRSWLSERFSFDLASCSLA